MENVTVAAPTTQTANSDQNGELKTMILDLQNRIKAMQTPPVTASPRVEITREGLNELIDQKYGKEKTTKAYNQTFEFVRNNWNELARSYPVNANTDSTSGNLCTTMLASGVVTFAQNRLAPLAAFTRNFTSIECAVARRAALMGNKERIKAKRLELESLNPLSPGEKNPEEHRDDVHVFIFQLVGNQRLFAIYSQLLDQIIRLRHYFNVSLDTDRTAQYYHEHVRILDALLESDTDKAEEAVLTHLRNASAYLTRLTLK